MLVLSLTVLRLMLPAAASAAGGACPLPVLRDRGIGFSVGRPEGWRLDVAAGALTLSPDASGLTSAIVAPVRLPPGGDAASALSGAAQRLSRSVAEAGGRLDAKPAGPGRLALAGRYKEEDIRGELRTRRAGASLVVFGGWAPAKDWERRKGTILDVGLCYEPAPGALLSPQRRTGGDPMGGSTTFDFRLPEGWRVAGVTSRGLDLDAGDAGVSFAYMTNAPGAPTAGQWLDQAAAMAGYSGINVLAETPLPSARDPMGLRWDMLARECEWTFQGRRLRGVLTGAVAGMSMGFYAVHSAMLSVRWAQARRWEEYSGLTAVVQESIRIAGAQPGRGLMLPKNNPADTSAIMGAWENRQRAEDRASARHSEAILGYDEVRSPATGESYQAPLNAWDPAGPDGPGYYRPLPGGGQEKLEPVNP
ncbi:MAG: hypothetical protein HY552_06115 [Elusimicrobia bacterium]|nr:hypothetical protein [Elusimicrobiota bacterium]